MTSAVASVKASWIRSAYGMREKRNKGREGKKSNSPLLAASFYILFTSI
jgi:hypothetical protein